jgi:hypothetical protein
MKSTHLRGVSASSKTLNGRRQFLVDSVGLASSWVALSAYGSDATSSAGNSTTPKDSGKRLFTKVVQVSMVVHSVEASVRRYWDDLGVWPWKLYTLNLSNTSSTTFHGRPVQHSFRAALANTAMWSGSLSSHSMVAAYMQNTYRNMARGCTTLHSMLRTLKKVTKELQSKGYENVQSGRVFGNDTYVYFNLNRGLACTAELNSNPTAPLPPPESTYP